MGKKKCDQCNDGYAIAKVEQEGDNVNWLCRPCVQDLAEQIATLHKKNKGTIKPNAVEFSPLERNDSERSPQKDSGKGEEDLDEVLDELSEDEFDSEELESDKYADVPVSDLLQKIYSQANFEEIEKDATIVAEAMEQQTICKKGEIECVPLKNGACALRIQGQGVFLYDADGVKAKIHAPGRPSKLKVIALNVILDFLGFDYCTCPSDETDELLLLPLETNKRLSLSVPRDLQKQTMSDLRKQSISEKEIQKQQKLQEQPQQQQQQQQQKEIDPELVERRNAARQAHLKSLESRPIWSGESNDKEWERGTPVDEIVSVVIEEMKKVVNKETTTSSPDYEPKMSFLQERKNFIFILDNLFPAGNRSLRMHQNYAMNLFAMESHYQKLRGKKLGTLKKPPAISQAPSEWDVKRLRKVDSPMKNLLPHKTASLKKKEEKDSLKNKKQKDEKSAKEGKDVKLDGQVIINVPLINKDKKVGYSTTTTVKQVIEAMTQWTLKKDKEKAKNKQFSLYLANEQLEGQETIVSCLKKSPLAASEKITLTLK